MNGSGKTKLLINPINPNPHNNCSINKEYSNYLLKPTCKHNYINNSNDNLINLIHSDCLMLPACKPNYITSPKDPYLKVDNFLSEYNTLEKLVLVRKNLGIDGLAYWGNIEGYIEDQKDLITYITSIQQGVQLDFESRLSIALIALELKLNKQLLETDEKLNTIVGLNIKGGLLTVDNITELENIPENKLQLGMLAYVTSLDEYFLYVEDGWRKASFNSTGIPTYTLEMYDNLNSKPDNYLLIRDPYPEKSTEDVSYLNVLFSAIRSLQAEVAKLKNSFKYGINSYTENKTAMSVCMEETLEDASEPLWALEEDALSLFIPGTINMDSSHKLIGDNIIADNELGLLNIEGEAYFQDPQDGFNKLADPKSIVFITTTGKNVELQLKADTGRLNIDLNDLNIPSVDLYNILFVVSKKTTKSLEDSTLYGHNFVWMLITDAKTNRILKSGYYNGSDLQITLYDFTYLFYIERIYFRNLVLSKLNSYVKAQDFSYEVIPSIPDEDDYKLGVAHLTIRSVSTPEVLNYVSNQLLSNELIWVESTRSLCIKSQGKIFNIGGNNKDNTMTNAELIAVLESLGIIVTTVGDNEYTLELADLTGVTFIHLDTGKKFDISVDSEGNLRSTPEVINLLQDRIKNAGGINNTNYRGFLSNLRLKENGGDVDKDSGLKSDRLKIGAIYAPIVGRTVFGCSHAYVELENTSNQDIALNGCYLHVAIPNNNNVKEIKTLALTGTIPAGGTFLIRGKQYTKFDDVNTIIKVTTFDLEWYDGGLLIDFLKSNLQFLLVYDKSSIRLDDLYITDHPTKKLSKTVCFQIDPSFIDGAWVRSKSDGCSWFNDTRFLVNDVTKVGNEDIPLTRDYILKNTFELDPAKLAFLSLCPVDSSRLRGTNKNDFKPFYIDIPIIEFPNSTPTYNVSLITPKASFLKKNVSTDKTKLNKEKPNMVYCSFGINMHTTRCFNWISVGSFDEYIWIRKLGDTDWTKFESYKEIQATVTQGTTSINRKEFSVNINNAVYARMLGRFPGDGSFYTAHKCIINVPEPTTSKTVYEYVVGRANVSGNMDENHISEILKFTIYPKGTTPKVYHITDLQGFYWLEYLTWAGSARALADTISKDTNTMPVIINTGDVTQNGTRINEWLDYYLAGYDLFKQYEHMSVVGNNDLCGTDPSILGTGDDVGKSNGYYHHLFNCYEIDTENLIVKGKYVPSVYYFDCVNSQSKITRFINVNSELTFINCRDWFGLSTEDTDVAYNIYTGWTTGNTKLNESPIYTTEFTPIYNILYQWLNGTHESIVSCHEIPFTVMTRENMSIGSIVGYREFSRSLDGDKGSLVGSHLNLLTKVDNVALNWFSRLLEYFNVKICLGGHKHTYTCTYPVREFYLYDDGTKNSLSNGPITMESTLANEYANGKHRITWEYTKAANDSLLIVKDTADDFTTQDGKYACFIPDDTTFNTTRLPLVKFGGGIKNASLGGGVPKYKSYKKEGLTSMYLPIIGVPNLERGVIYFMCQATGYKQTSNKELPGVGLAFSMLLPLTQYDSEKDKDTASSWQQVPMFGILEFVGSERLLYLARIMNIQAGEKKPLYTDSFSTKTPELQYMNLVTDYPRFGTWNSNKNYIINYEV